MKPTIWIFSIEPLESRYTAQWHQHVPRMLTEQLGDQFQVIQVDGVQQNTVATPGAFLNFSDTNYWKSSQLCNFLEHYNRGAVGANDHCIFTDAWNPAILQVKYMRDLLGHRWQLHGLWHAGSYDPHDFLGRLIGSDPWVRHTEKALVNSLDYNWFATDFHIDLFGKNLLDWSRDLGGMTHRQLNMQGIYRTGWPMDYLPTVLEPHSNATKRDLILFPHRIAPEKQVNIFRDLATQLPEYEFVVCQDQQLTKEQYHDLLAASKMVFSASLQETLGIGCYEGALLGAMPLVPDRLSYSEMYPTEFKYPSEWTRNWDSYVENREQLVAVIMQCMSNYQEMLPRVRQLACDLTGDFFTATALVSAIRDSDR
jgi:hypothetical protein